MSEHDQQCALIRRVRLREAQEPELRLLFAIPNGGNRNEITGARLKAEGTKCGVPDLFLPVARRGFHGLWIEMKDAGKTANQTQKDLHADLRAEGFRVEVYDDWWNAWICLADYLGFDPNV